MIWGLLFLIAVVMTVPILWLAIGFGDAQAYVIAAIFLAPFWVLWWRSVQWARPRAQQRRFNRTELLRRKAELLEPDEGSASLAYATEIEQERKHQSGVAPAKGSFRPRPAAKRGRGEGSVQRSPWTGPNPWADLPDTPPFVAAADAEYIRRYPGPASKLRLELLPSPYVGKPDARVYLLLLNPGGGEDDFMHGGEWVQERRRALRFECSDCFWPLHPSMVGGEAHKYVAGRLRSLIAAVGPECVAQRMMWLPLRLHRTSQSA